MMDIALKTILSMIKNLFTTAEFQKRYSNDQVQIKTAYNKVVEGKEAFPYGFRAKAKSGKSFIFCQGGNYDAFEIMPITDSDVKNAPALQDGDSALYSDSGGWVVCRSDGTVEINGNVKSFVTWEDLNQALLVYHGQSFAAITAAAAATPPTPATLPAPDITAAKTDKVMTA